MATFLSKNINTGYLKNRLTLKEQGGALIRISDMLINGFTLNEALVFQSRLNRKHEDLYMRMIDGIQGGKPPYEVLSECHFDNQACAQLFFADKHGYIAEALKESGEYLLRKTSERKKLFNLMQYPLILLFVLVIIGILMQWLLLPRFKTLYSSMDFQPGVGITLILHLTQNISIYFTSLILAISAVFIVIKTVINKKTAIEKASFYSRVPLIHSFYTLYQTVFLSREWSFLLKSGFSMNEVIKIMEAQNFRPLLRETAEEIKDLLMLGYSFSDAISELPYIEEELKVIIAHGEQNGRLDSELQYFSQICLQTLEEKTIKVFQIIQPIIFVLIGLIVITVYMSIFLPMFQMIESI
ncbi:type II secretion system protein [Lederbergia lenta]|uniref:Type II secretion system protein n=1 Tax=Lederbergia lenta TaxID=1467 RepID=A0A2X4VZ86_LEDLE|nr:type II secretion system protein [Lederbergia lenta]